MTEDEFVAKIDNGKIMWVRSGKSTYSVGKGTASYPYAMRQDDGLVNLYHDKEEMFADIRTIAPLSNWKVK